MPRDERELADVIRAAEADRCALVPCGAGTHSFLGNPPPASARRVSLEGFDRICAYEPDDFTIGVGAGVPLRELREHLAAHGQEIASDWPARAAGTVGGWVASALVGPRRAFLGDLRAQLIGVEGMRGGGRRFKAGGMVVKNVAGYDIAKFLCGALGTAGVQTRWNFKLRPLPACRVAAIARFSRREAAWRFTEAFRRRALEPAALILLDPSMATRALSSAAEAWSVVWVFEGNRSLVAWLEREARRLVSASSAELETCDGEQAERWLDELREIFDPARRIAGQAVVRVAVLPHRAETFVEGAWFDLSATRAAHVAVDASGGQAILEWEASPEGLLAPLERITARVAGAGGFAWLLSLPPSVRSRASWLLGEDPAAEVARKILAVFDPEGIFSPGRIL